MPENEFESVAAVPGAPAPAGGGEDDVAEALRRAKVKLAEVATRMQNIEAERDNWRKKYRSAVRSRDHHQSVAEAMARSGSYRLGRAIVSMVRNPVQTTPQLMRAASRRLRAPRVAAVSASPIVQETKPVAKAVTPAAAKARPADGPRPVLSETLDVYAYVALGMDFQDLRAMVRAIGQCAMVVGNHVPLVITDVTEFSMLRDTGMAIEYVPNRVVWERHRDDLDWNSFQSERIGRLIRVHRPARTIFLNPADPLDLPRLLALNAG